MIKSYYVCDICGKKIEDALQVYKFGLKKTTIEQDFVENTDDICNDCAHRLMLTIRQIKLKQDFAYQQL